MPTLNISTARKTFFKIMDEVARTHHPITVTGQNRQPVVIIAEQDWRDIQETIYLSSIPGMDESIIRGGKTPILKCKAWTPRDVESGSHKAGTKRRKASVARKASATSQ
jgi:prevent-host-death family protein